MKKLLFFIAPMASMQRRAQSQPVDRREDSSVNPAACFRKGTSVEHAIEQTAYKIDGKEAGKASRKNIKAGNRRQAARPITEESPSMKIQDGLSALFIFQSAFITSQLM